MPMNNEERAKFFEENIRTIAEKKRREMRKKEAIAKKQEEKKIRKEKIAKKVAKKQGEKARKERAERFERVIRPNLEANKDKSKTINLSDIRQKKIESNRKKGIISGLAEVNNNETLKDAIKTGRFIDNTITEKDAKSSDSHDYR